MDLVLQIVNNPSGAGGGTGGGGTACNPGLLWCGISGRQLGKVEPNTSIILDLKMIALQPGLQVRFWVTDPRICSVEPILSLQWLFHSQFNVRS